MKRNLFDFADEKLPEEDQQKNEGDYEKEYEKEVEKLESRVSDDIKKDAKEMFEKYKDFSKEDLTDEFISTSRQKIKEGCLSAERIRETFEKVAPFLNQNQKSFFEDLLKKIDE